MNKRMKNYRLILSAILISIFLVTGCGKRADELPEDPVIATTAEASVETGGAAETSVETGGAAETSVETDGAAEAIAETDDAAEEATVVTQAATESTTEEVSRASTEVGEESAAEGVTEEPAQEKAAPEPAPTPTVDYGRIVFTGDSRTVDMFDPWRNEIWDETHDGMRVFCRDACKSDYMINAVYSVGYDNFDTLISWMGCNDYGNFEPYRGFYEEVLANGKNLILCTVGPTDDATLADYDREDYSSDKQVTYNAAMQDWAARHGVKVIPLYDYICAEIAAGNLKINPEDGIHFVPQPTTAIWNKILSSIR